MAEHLQDILEYVDRSLNEEEDFHFLRFEQLQRVNITRLQLGLVQIKERLKNDEKFSDQDLDGLKVKLEDYTTAIRNYQYLQDKKQLEKNEMRSRKLLLQRYFQTRVNSSFQSHYCYFREADEKIDHLRRTLMHILPSRLAFSTEERLARKKEYYEGKAPKQVSAFVDRLARFLVAFAGGVFLIVPMIIMTLDPSQTKGLVVVSVSVIILMLLLSFAVRVSNIEILVAAAAYAAVLVVFVGATNG
ncbi:hypothetical protein BDW74DRAFT_160767 [Aspergillus multicolor]|uniref:uncharacterized protein n=1 Tax=Aspergillus multicolor TaxID=41759 RepID=UPI003CCDA27A